MSETIIIPKELYDDLVKIVNRLQVCLNQNSGNFKDAETSQNELADRPPSLSKETIQYNKFVKMYGHLFNQSPNKKKDDF